MAEVTCSRCGQTREALPRLTYPGEFGQRILKEICQQCWSDWLKQQTMLINHYGLNVMDRMTIDGYPMPGRVVLAHLSWEPGADE